jgi:DNA repair protein RecO (recombination protein O)
MALVHYRTKGIILDKKDRGEADQMLSIFTEDFGLISVLAKSVRKIGSKLRPGAEIFCFSEIEFIQGKIGKILTDAVLIKKFGRLRENLTKFKLAREMSDILRSAIIGQEKDGNIWDLIRSFLEAIEKVSAIEGASAIYYSFLCKFFSILGYGIDFCKYEEYKNSIDIISQKAHNSLKLYND